MQQQTEEEKIRYSKLVRRYDLAKATTRVLINNLKLAQVVLDTNEQERSRWYNDSRENTGDQILTFDLERSVLELEKTLKHCQEELFKQEELVKNFTFKG